VISQGTFKEARPHRRPSGSRHTSAAIAGALAMCVSAEASSAAPSYNPDGLDTVQLTRVLDVCEHVLGLRASEPLTGGVWIHANRLDYWTSHYRGCVLALSDAVINSTRAGKADDAHRSCEAKGLKVGTPDYGSCMLSAMRQGSAAASAKVDANLAEPESAEVAQQSTSFFSSSPRTTASREELACASVGVDPAGPAFETCVKELDSILYAIDHPATD
jgi:hypothetical protein